MFESIISLFCNQDSIRSCFGCGRVWGVCGVWLCTWWQLTSFGSESGGVCCFENHTSDESVEADKGRDPRRLDTVCCVFCLIDDCGFLLQTCCHSGTLFHYNFSPWWPFCCAGNRIRLIGSRHGAQSWRFDFSEPVKMLMQMSTSC